jgi:hypothetical protein
MYSSSFDCNNNVQNNTSSSWAKRAVILYRDKKASVPVEKSGEKRKEEMNDPDRNKNDRALLALSIC